MERLLCPDTVSFKSEINRKVLLKYLFLVHYHNLTLKVECINKND